MVDVKKRNETNESVVKEGVMERGRKKEEGDRKEWIILMRACERASV